MLDVILDALIDTLKAVPVLLLVYLLIEFLTHHKNQPFTFISKKGKKWSPLLGALLGSVPQCGFSAAMADLYSQRKITVGTLFAIFLATSDEAIPLLISNPTFYKEMLIIIGIKLVLAIVFGYVIDLILSEKLLQKFKKRFTKQPEEKHDHCHCGHNHKEEVHCQHDHCCADNIFVNASIHTLKIAGFILLINLILGTVIHFVNLENFVNAMSVNKYLQPLIACLIGIIPNCAGSVFLIEIFLAGGLSLAALIGGLSAGSGIGIMILFKKNKNIKENILILLSLYVIGVIIGIALTPVFA